MSMKSDSRIFNTLLLGWPALLLTLPYPSVARAQLAAPVLDPSSCSTPPNRTYRIMAGTTPPSATNPYIRSNGLATWSFPSPASDTCTVAGSARVCAGLSVTLPGGNANVTPDFTGTATSSSQQVRVTATRAGNSCTADFTFMTSAGGGWGWGEADGTGGAAGGGDGAGGAEANGGDGAGGAEANGGGAGDGAEANGGGARGGEPGEAGSPSLGGASGGAVTSESGGLGSDVGNASGAGSGGTQSGGVSAGAPDDTPGESSGCSCSLPGQTLSSNRSAVTAIMIGLLLRLQRRNARRRSQSRRV